MLRAQDAVPAEEAIWPMLLAQEIERHGGMWAESSGPDAPAPPGAQP